MQKEFKIVLQEEDSNELLQPYIQAEDREMFLFDLFHNFLKKWKYGDGIVHIEEVKEKLFEMKEYYKITLKDE